MMLLVARSREFEFKFQTILLSDPFYLFSPFIDEVMEEDVICWRCNLAERKQQTSNFFSKNSGKSNF